ncbi:MAG: 50S ribosomal protein L30 [Thermoplasmata archaeon]|nr:50S ribosomal protein L30 [Thermoplasmata archaeon]
MTYAVIRVRGTVGITRDIADTLRFLRLNKSNHCVVIPKNPQYEGMLQKAKDYITWGEIQPETLAKMLVTRGSVAGQKITDTYVKKNSKYKSVIAFAKAVAKGDETMGSLSGLSPVVRLHPPHRGFEGVKKPYTLGGSLGYRGEKINDLLTKMLFVHEG